jgi:hypothetical protein
MKKLITLIVIAALGISMIGCAGEKKPAAPAAPPGGGAEAKPDSAPEPAKPDEAK